MIRLAEERDMEAVYSIECECFSHPWKKEEFYELLTFPWCKFFVLEEDEEIIGYLDIAYSPDFVELYNIAVKKSLQGKGYGQKLLDFLFEEAERVKAEKIFLEVRKSNPAHELYLKNGFTDVRIRKGYYGEEDGIDMMKEMHG